MLITGKELEDFEYPNLIWPTAAHARRFREKAALEQAPVLDQPVAVLLNLFCWFGVLHALHCPLQRLRL